MGMCMWYRQTCPWNGSIDAGGSLGLSAKGLAIDLEIAGSGPVSCHFFIPFFFIMCSCLAYSCPSLQYHGMQTIFISLLMRCYMQFSIVNMLASVHAHTHMHTHVGAYTLIM